MNTHKDILEAENHLLRIASGEESALSEYARWLQDPVTVKMMTHLERFRSTVVRSEGFSRGSGLDRALSLGLAGARASSIDEIAQLLFNLPGFAREMVPADETTAEARPAGLDDDE